VTLPDVVRLEFKATAVPTPLTLVPVAANDPLPPFVSEMVLRDIPGALLEVPVSERLPLVAVIVLLADAFSPTWLVELPDKDTLPAVVTAVPGDRLMPL
jgi:hypothetical protein